MKNLIKLAGCAACLLLMAACSKNKVVLSGEIDGANQKKAVLSVLNINTLSTVDTISTDKNGHFRHKVTLAQKAPDFYYLSYNGTTIASLILEPGKSVKIKVDTLGNNLEVSGSQESELLAQVNSRVARAQKSFDSLTVQLLESQQSGDAESYQRLRVELGRLYVKEKQDAIKSILRNPYSFTNITQLYRSFSESLPLFAQLTDGIYYQQVMDSLQKVYPDSRYVKVLENEATRLFNQMELTSRLDQAGQTQFPELELPDINAQSQKLSALEGRPFLLFFWDSGEASQNMLLGELEKLYYKYGSKGFEIYAVSVNPDKAGWANIVKRFSWINVNDGKGLDSYALRAYNVQSLPAIFLFNRSGDIVGKGFTDLARVESALSKL